MTTDIQDKLSDIKQKIVSIRENHEDKLNKPPSLLAAKWGQDMPSWCARHNAALASNKGFEFAIVTMLVAWSEYAAEYKSRFLSLIGDDSVLGPVWQSIGENLRTLLNGELGGLDAGTLDNYIVGTMEYHGIDTSEL